MKFPRVKSLTGASVHMISQDYFSQEKWVIAAAGVCRLDGIGAFNEEVVVSKAAGKVRGLST